MNFTRHLSLIAFLLVLIALPSCKPGDIPFTQSSWEDEANDAFNGSIGIPNEFTRFQYDYTTSGGIHIKSVVPVPPAFMGYADQGRQRQIDRFKTMFPNFPEVPDTTILIIHPNHGFNPDGTPSGPPCVTEVNDPGAPCLYVGGRKAAGTMLGNDDHWRTLDQVNPIVLAEQTAQNWTHVEWFIETVANEREHVSAWRNRQIMPPGWPYAETVYDHFRYENDQHPMTWSAGASLKQTPLTPHFVK